MSGSSRSGQDSTTRHLSSPCRVPGTTLQLALEGPADFHLPVFSLVLGGGVTLPLQACCMYPEAVCVCLLDKFILSSLQSVYLPLVIFLTHLFVLRQGLTLQAGLVLNLYASWSLIYSNAPVSTSQMLGLQDIYLLFSVDTNTAIAMLLCTVIDGVVV